MRAALALLAGIVLALMAFTWWALESGGVAVVETRRPDGGTRTTHVWFVEDEGVLWVEAGAPENGWFTDVQREPLLHFSAEARAGTYRARPVPGAAQRDALRAELRARYGLRDAWVSLFVDSQRSVPVRLEPVAP